MLDWFTQFGNQITSLGLTSRTLLIAIGILTVVLFLSIREFATWFLKMSRMVNQQKEINERLKKIESQLGLLKSSGDQIQTILESQAPQFPLSTNAQKEPWMEKPLI